MKNIYDVIRQKELDMQQLQKEVEALRLAARLLADDSDGLAEGYPKPATTTTGVASSVRSQTMAAKPAETGFGTPRDNGIRQFP